MPLVLRAPRATRLGGWGYYVPNVLWVFMTDRSLSEQKMRLDRESSLDLWSDITPSSGGPDGSSAARQGEILGRRRNGGRGATGRALHRLGTARGGARRPPLRCRRAVGPEAVPRGAAGVPPPGHRAERDHLRSARHGAYGARLSRRAPRSADHGRRPACDR